jgi:two-component system C4-dicarboxylate transport response regulator DctD
MNEPIEKNYRVIVVDDDKEMRSSLSFLLTKAKWQVKSLSRAEDTERELEHFNADVILSDVRMPGMDGIELLKKLKKLNAPPVVLISAHGDIPLAVEVMQSGAYSFIEKPTDPRRILTVLRNAAEHYRLSEDTKRLKAQLADLSGLDRALLGKTEIIKTLKEDIVDLARADIAVMLRGETGTGKELVARGVHNLSPRVNAPFVVLNCATIPAQHFEETIYGVEGQKPGVFEKVKKGTLFLDDLSHCPIELQPKVLRMIEEKEFIPVGGSEPQKLDVRYISAVDEKIEQTVNEGKLRKDLYYRLNTLILRVPPLRERREDIPLLYANYMQQYGELYEVISPEITTEDMTLLMSHEWPGNVRELRNVAERRILMARRGGGSVSEALQVDTNLDDVQGTLREAVAALERQLIAQALKANQGRMDAVAEALGIGRRTLNEKIVKLGLNKKEVL